MSLPVVAGAQTPRADYQFNNDLTSSAGTAGSLTELTGGGYSYSATTVNGQPDTVLQIGTTSTNTTTTAGGLQTPANPFADGTNYTIDLLASFTLNSANVVATKVFDFASLGSDAGIYINDTTGFIELVNGSGTLVAAGTDAALSGTYFHLTLTRSAAGLLTVFMNGMPEISYDDSTTALTTIASGNKLGIFANDTGGALGSALSETTFGDVARLQLFDGPLTQAQVTALVPEPSTWAVLAGGSLLLGMIALRRRALP